MFALLVENSAVTQNDQISALLSKKNKELLFLHSIHGKHSIKRIRQGMSMSLWLFDELYAVSQLINFASKKISNYHFSEFLNGVFTRNNYENHIFPAL